jgi:glycine C-acetyltransferase
MSVNNIEKVLSQTLTELENEGRLKGKEYIITKVKKAQGEKGPRYFLKGKGEQEFIRMNSKNMELDRERSVLLVEHFNLIENSKRN